MRNGIRFDRGQSYQGTQRHARPGAWFTFPERGLAFSQVAHTCGPRQYSTARTIATMPALTASGSCPHAVTMNYNSVSCRTESGKDSGKTLSP